MTDKKYPVKVEDADSYWVGSPAKQFYDSTPREGFAKELVDKRNEVEVLAEWACPDLSYEYDEYAVVRLHGTHAVLNTTGCSCPSPAETWDVLFEGSLTEVLEYLENEGDHPADFFYSREKEGCKILLTQLKDALKEEEQNK